MVRSLLTAAAAVLLVPGICSAAKIKVWNHHSASDYDKAQFRNAVVNSDGALQLAREVKSLAGLDATHVWDVAEDRDGNLYVATGDEGKLYKVAADGKVSVAYTSDDSQILCLAPALDGSIYAGTGPNGKVLRIDPQGETKILFETSESYVWSLAVDAKGEVIYAGTGAKGRIYRITPDGKGSLFYSTKQEHILCLATASDGILYAGTDKAGLVYRIDAKGKGFVLFSAPQSEIRKLVVTADAVYAGTSSPTRRRTSGAGSTGASSTFPPASSQPASGLSAGKLGTTKTAEGPATIGSPSSVESKEGSKSPAAPAPVPPTSGDNSLLRISRDGTVREIFRERALILSLLRGNGRFFIGTGMDGQLFEVDETSKERSEVVRLDHGQILSLFKRRDGSIVLGTGDPGKLYVLSDKYARTGTVTSEVLDARMISKWGALRWNVDTPTGSAVTVAVRSGNVAEPDDTWSDWSSEQTDPRQATAAAPTARFLQYRVTLNSDSPAVTPSFRDLTLRYLNSNQAPEVTGIDVPNLDAVNLDNPKKFKFKWSATDANEDELTYNLYVRKDGWKNWVLLEEEWEKREYEWDTTTTPSGEYHLKVVASDRRDNPEEEALTGERTSKPFVVSHTPPTVNIKVVGIDGDHAILEATATDPLVRLTGASFAVNGKKWINVFPADGLFDSKTETFKFKTDALKPGSYVLVLKVKDAAGNTGSGDVVFTVHERGK
ncbi:MAG TPA: two-component regulator propeller domain-containing protein [Gemmataceae bacterium]